MTQTSRSPLLTNEADIEYLDGDFRIRKPGAFVLCAVTRKHIPLDELRYWNVDRQEAYADPEAKRQSLAREKKPASMAQAPSS